MDRVVWKRIGRSLLVLLGIAVFVLAIIYVTPLVYPFIIGWLLAYFINPVVNMLNRRLKFPRWLAVSLTLLLFVSGLLTIATALVTKMVVEIIYLSKSLNSRLNGGGISFKLLSHRPIFKI